MNIEILNEQGEVVSTIVADSSFAEQNYTGKWRVASTQPQDIVQVNPTEWMIDIGPFFDRFGAAKMAVLTSTDLGIKAILSDTQVRKWIDLKRLDVVQSIAYIASVIPSVTPALQDSIINTPVSEEENLALRRLYF